MTWAAGVSVGLRLGAGGFVRTGKLPIETECPSAQWVRLAPRVNRTETRPCGLALKGALGAARWVRLFQRRRELVHRRWKTVATDLAILEGAASCVIQVGGQPLDPGARTTRTRRLPWRMDVSVMYGRVKSDIYGR